MILGIKPLIYNEKREDDYSPKFRIEDELAVTATIRIARRKVKKKKKKERESFLHNGHSLGRFMSAEITASLILL